MQAAKNRAIDVLRRERTARNIMPRLARDFESEWTLVPTVNGLFGAEAIRDDQLRMMFSCCDPELSHDVQVPLILALLCGFTSNEIASAFLSKRDAIAKRIERGKKALAASRTLFDFREGDVPARLIAVQRALYLLFNEGYHGTSARGVVRGELCREAMRLAALLLENPATASPSSYALCALMWLGAARLPARVNRDGDLVALYEQDRSLWDSQLIWGGKELLNRASAGTDVSPYHLEAAIALVHCSAGRVEETDWARLVWLYDMLLTLQPSPVIALNRAIAVAHVSGPERGIEEIRSIAHLERLERYPFLHAALGEFELRAGRGDAARPHFERAASLARTSAERRFLEQRLKAISPAPA